MVTCLFCRNTGVMPIKSSNGINQPVQNYMLKCFGKCIEDSFRDDDALCTVCSLVVKFIAELKNILLPFIIREQDYNYKDCDKPRNINVINLWERTCNSNINYEQESPTPNLYDYAREEEYNKAVEQQLEIDEYKRRRSESRQSDSRQSDAGSELSKYLKTDRKRRRKRRLSFTHRKKHKYDTQHLSQSRSSSLLSCSTYDMCGSESDIPIIVREKHIYCTDKPNNELDYDIILQKKFQYYCNEQNCNNGYETLEEWTTHLVNYHRKLAFHNCTLCKNMYTTRDHLKEHMKSQHKMTVICRICEYEFSNDKTYVEHWQEHHVKNSVKCSKCSKYYLNDSVLYKHIREEHNSSNNQRTLSRVSYTDDSTQNGIMEDNSNIRDNNNFEVKVLIQSTKKIII